MHRHTAHLKFIVSARLLIKPWSSCKVLSRKGRRVYFLICRLQVKCHVLRCFTSVCSISSTLVDMESMASSGRSTPAMLNCSGTALSSSSSSSIPVCGKSLSYKCCWDHCQMLFPSSPDLAEHIRATHVDGQRGGVSATLTIWLLSDHDYWLSRYQRKPICGEESVDSSRWRHRLVPITWRCFTSHSQDGYSTCFLISVFYWSVLRTFVLVAMWTHLWVHEYLNFLTCTIKKIPI